MSRPWDKEETPLTDKAYNKVIEKGPCECHGMVPVAVSIARERRLRAAERLLDLATDTAVLPKLIHGAILNHLAAAREEDGDE